LTLHTADIYSPTEDTPDDDAPPPKKLREHSPEPLRADDLPAIERLTLHTADIDPSAEDTPGDDLRPKHLEWRKQHMQTW